MTAIKFTLNHEVCVGDVDDRQTLADFLRDQCSLTAVHLGCEHGACGACTVEMDAQAVRSCLVLAVMCEGKTITTLDGLADDRIMSELKSQFHLHHALQCGFCTSGFLMMARDILRRNVSSCRKSDFVREELAGHICRCTGYNGIIKAVTETAHALLATQIKSA
jgi:aerobic carbon-monoxide dehydrogenase small subunit